LSGRTTPGPCRRKRQKDCRERQSRVAEARMPSVPSCLRSFPGLETF
jgi:hypothetical protein